jgi:hypothetical protein
MLRSTKTRDPVANQLLAALPGKEYQRLRPHLARLWPFLIFEKESADCVS